jgi:hypothetical protein
MNFVFPILILINSDFKGWILVMAGVVILAGHYIDFNMVMPGTVGDRWFIGVSEIASVIFFLVIYLCCVHGIG